MSKIRLMTAMVAITTISFSSVAEARSTKNIPRTSPPREVVDPYQSALSCIATKLTPEQRATSIGVLYFADRAGKEAYAPEGASGKFLSQGSEDMLLNSLAATGMTVVEAGPTYRAMIDWTTPKLRGSNQPANVVLADIVVQGSYTTFDFNTSQVNEIFILGIGGGTRAYSVTYTADLRATSMPGGKLPGGVVMATLSLEKNVVGRETRAGVAAFFGPANSSTFVELNINHQKRELMQYSQRFMASRAAFGIVSKVWNITGCNEHLQYGDNLISGQFTESSSNQNTALTTRK
ncbi:MAG: hypothetical protein RLZZ480_814 [Candidatus Parcubacteria bacterium]|jgi:curli biogenesis system outer membrane secretion channel CsgG